MLFAAMAFGSSLLVAPFLMMFLCIIFMASLGKSFGVRRFYVKMLLKVFEYGRQNIETAKNLTRVNFDISGSSEEEPSLQQQLAASSTLHSNEAGDSIAVSTRPQSTASPTHPTKDSHFACNHHSGNGHLPNNAHSNGHSLITRDALILLPDGDRESKAGKGGQTNATTEITSDAAGEPHFEFDLSNCLDYVKAGIESIIEDDVTSRFEAEELKNWNLLTRTNRYYEFISWRLSVIWVCGFVVRYLVLMPVRVMTCFLGVLWLTFCTALVGTLSEGETKRWLVKKVSLQCFSLLSSALSAVVNFHNIENKPKSSGICVANHTSPIDVLILMQDNTYSLIGQSHGGFLGVLQRALARASPHIWFERAEAKDRMAVAQRLRTHVSDPTNPPILIFPEGTCINNTSVMQFKKGSFEVGGVIYPIAVKYDPRFGDPFWNSSKYSMMQHLFLMMTSWAIVCDVWYLPPMYRAENETAIAFANRVKSVIAKQGGLLDLVWDGNLKRNKPKEEWKEKQQEDFTNRIKTD